MMKEEKYTFCRICEASCGLKVSVENDKVIDVKPDEGHVVTKGYACIKGLTPHNFQYTPDRILSPQKKVGDSYESISWQQAFAEIGAKLKGITQQHGGDAAGLYLGNPASFSFLAPLFSNGLVAGLGSSKMYHTGSQDCNNKFVVAERIYGSAQAQTFPDVDHSELLISIGSNPAISKMSFIHLPHPIDRLKAIEQRGGRVVFINPRKTESAKQMGEHQFIRPDTDVYFILAFLHELLARDQTESFIDRERIVEYMNGFEQLAAIAQAWTPERSAVVTGVDAANLRELVAAYISASKGKGAALYCSTGVNQGSNGTITFWLLEVINAISGNLDRRGGTLMGKGLIDIAKFTANDNKPQNYSRIGNVPLVMDTVPAGILADDILTPGEGQLKALVVVGGNPLLTCSNSQRLGTAFEQLDLMISIDLVKNETANYADYILPATHFLERADVPFTFFTLMGLMPVPYFQYTDKMVNAPGECQTETWILANIARAAGAPMFGSRIFQGLLNLGGLLATIPVLGSWLTPASERMYGLIGLLTRQGGLRKMRKQPHGKLLEPREQGDYLGQRVATSTGKVELAPQQLLDLCAKLEGDYQREVGQRGRLKIVSKRERFSHNTWTHNDATFVKGKHGSNYIYLHPDDAAAHQVKEGDMVEVSNALGAIIVPAAITDDMMPGAAALPHGWGHGEAEGLSVARTTGGANVNILASDGPDSLEPISGMSPMNGIVVDIKVAV